MEKNAFVSPAEPWWLLEHDMQTNNLTESRDQLAQDLGWDHEWYTNETRVLELYEMIEEP